MKTIFDSDSMTS